MVYIQGGKIIEKRPFGLHVIINFFTAIINLIIAFFHTLFNHEATGKYTSGSIRISGGGGSKPPGFSGRAPGRFMDMKRFNPSNAGPGCAPGGS